MKCFVKNNIPEQSFDFIHQSHRKTLALKIRWWTVQSFKRNETKYTFDKWSMYQNAYLQFVRTVTVLQNCTVKMTWNCKELVLFNLKMNRIKLTFIFKASKVTMTEGCSWDFITLASCLHQYFGPTLIILRFLVIFLSPSRQVLVCYLNRLQWVVSASFAIYHSE